MGGDTEHAEESRLGVQRSWYRYVGLDLSTVGTGKLRPGEEASNDKI
jgi:hypothetical protein